MNPGRLEHSLHCPQMETAEIEAMLEAPFRKMAAEAVAQYLRRIERQDKDNEALNGECLPSSTGVSSSKGSRSDTGATGLHVNTSRDEIFYGPNSNLLDKKDNYDRERYRRDRSSHERYVKAF